MAGRTRFYRSENDIQNIKIDKDDKVILYDRAQKKRKFTEKSVTGTNFADVEKIEYAFGILELLDDTEKLKRELTESYIREKFLMKKLLEAGVPSAFTPEELKEFKIDIDVVMREKIDKVLEGDILDLKKDIALRVHREISNSFEDFASDGRYELIRTNSILALNDIELDELRKSQMAKDKKAVSIHRIEDMSLKFMNKKEELIEKYKKEDNISGVKKSEGSGSTGENLFGGLAGFGDLGSIGGE